MHVLLGAADTGSMPPMRSAAAMILTIGMFTSSAVADSSLVLPAGRLRLEAGPPDLALLDSGLLGEGRGLRVGRIDRGGNGDAVAQLGLGLSYGLSSRWEAGVLAAPVLLAPDADYGDLEMHTRFSVAKARHVQFALQAVLQFPTRTDFGLALGAPLRIGGGRVVADTGFEIEMLFGDLDLVNLDIPFALNVYLSPSFFVGARTGLFMLDFDDVFVPLGFQVGGHAARRKVDLVSWFLWPPPPWRGNRDTIDVSSFQLGFGVNFLIDT